jgi:hypothetical protein
MTGDRKTRTTRASTTLSFLARDAGDERDGIAIEFTAVPDGAGRSLAHHQVGEHQGE